MFDMYVIVQFTKPKGKFLPIFSWVIRVVQGTKYSHVRLKWKSVSGAEIIYEASGTSIKVVGKYAQNKYSVDIIKSYKIYLTKEEYKKLIKLLDYASVDYGIKQAFGIGIAKMLGMKKNPFSDGTKDSQVCSELLALFLKSVKDWAHGLDKDMAGPLEIDKELEKLCKLYPDEIEKVL